MKNIHRILILGTSALALAGCDASEIVSPGTGGDIIINNPAPTPAPSPTTPVGNVTPAAECPDIADDQGLTDTGTITGPSGTWRVCELPAVINTSSTLEKVPGVLYSLGGRTDVGEDGGATASGSDTNVTLTIRPGVVVFGDTGRSYLVVNRGNKLEAAGTSTQPIIFTSRSNVLGNSTESTIGQWGGVVLLGRAPVSDCREGGINPPNRANCEQELEGAALTTLFGGNTANDDSGTLQYVQIRYSGFSLALGSELQSLTTGGIGSGTTIDHLQTFNSSDDGMEFFGGTVKMSEVVVVGADDDSVDVDTGAQADLKNVIVVQRSGGGDNIVELDSPDEDYDTDALPQTVLRMSNFTFVQRSSASSQAIRMRGGAFAKFMNGVIDTNDSACVRVDDQVTIDAAPTFDSVVGDCNDTTPFIGGDVDASAVEALWTGGTNTDQDFVITLTNIYVNGTNENGVTVFNSNGVSSFFGTPANIGAVFPGNNTWADGWTCTSGTAPFANSAGPCTAIPVL